MTLLRMPEEAQRMLFSCHLQSDSIFKSSQFDIHHIFLAKSDSCNGLCQSGDLCRVKQRVHIQM